MMLDFFNNLEHAYNVDELKNQYINSKPLPHFIIDDFLPKDIFDLICTEIKNFPQDKWIVKNLKNSGIRKETRDFTSSPALQETMIHLTSHSFVSWLNKITDCDQIIPDIHHLGAGLSAAPSGSFLGLHTDFNWNDTLKLNRKFNLIFYVNEKWEDSWNGELEFWDREKTECLHAIKPVPNRLLFWEYEQELIHGFSKPLNCPSGIERQNLMTVYYISNASPTSQPHKSEFY